MVAGSTVRTDSALNCRPYWGWAIQAPVNSTDSPILTPSMLPITGTMSARPSTAN